MRVALPSTVFGNVGGWCVLWDLHKLVFTTSAGWTLWLISFAKNKSLALSPSCPPLGEEPRLLGMKPGGERVGADRPPYTGGGGGSGAGPVWKACVPCSGRLGLDTVLY